MLGNYEAVLKMADVSRRAMTALRNEYNKDERFRFWAAIRSERNLLLNSLRATLPPADLATLLIERLRSMLDLSASMGGVFEEQLEDEILEILGRRTEITV